MELIRLFIVEFICIKYKRWNRSKTEKVIAFYKFSVTVIEKMEQLYAVEYLEEELKRTEQKLENDKNTFEDRKSVV